MPYDSQGVFTRVMNWQEDAANSVPIVASRHDDEDDNFAQGFNEVLCRDGRAAMTGSLKMGANKITNMANGTTNNDAVNLSQLNALNTTLTTAINTAITNCKNALFPVGGIYATVGNTNPNTLLGFGTWSLITSKVVIPSGKIPVYGDGKTLGLTNGTNNKGLVGFNASPYTAFNASTSSLGSDVGTAASADGVTYTSWGVVTEGESGLVADMSGATSVTIYIWKRTA
jgi:hypothetical protein